MHCLRPALALLLLGGAARAADWPQWLGPHRDASSPETVAPWKEPPAVAWRHAVGEGHSSPVVAGGRVFVHAKVADKDEEEVLAFDAGTGERVWRVAYQRGPFNGLFGKGPRATPAVADGRVYTFGATGILSCWDAAHGTKVWQVDTLKEFHARNLFFGASCSPLVEGGRVLVNVGGKGASVVAFDAADGHVVWKALDDRASYSSPIAVGKGSHRHVIFFTGHGLAAFNPADGSVLWQFPLEDKLSESSVTPVRAGGVLVAGTITRGSLGLRPEKGDKPGVEQVWSNPALTCYFSTPVAVGRDDLYMVTGTTPSPFASPHATLRCVDAHTGKERWSKADVGKYHASLLRTGDGKLLLLEEAGSLALVDPNPRAYRELARAKVCGETWAHPALANGRLYLRDNRALICLKLADTP